MLPWEESDCFSINTPSGRVSLHGIFSPRIKAKHYKPHHALVDPEFQGHLVHGSFQNFLIS